MRSRQNIFPARYGRLVMLMITIVKHLPLHRRAVAACRGTPSAGWPLRSGVVFVGGAACPDGALAGRQPPCPLTWWLQGR